MVGFFFLSSRMMVIYDDFQVKEIDLATRELVKEYNL
jgi:hypothetical protein